jgi:hypothetical protein
MLSSLPFLSQLLFPLPSLLVVAAVAVAAAGVIDARSLIMAIEQEGSKPSFDALRQCNGDVQQMDCVMHVKALLEEGVGGDTHLCLLPKWMKRQRINQPQQQGTKKLVAGGGGNG